MFRSFRDTSPEDRDCSSVRSGSLRLWGLGKFEPGLPVRGHHAPLLHYHMPFPKGCRKWSLSRREILQDVIWVPQGAQVHSADSSQTLLVNTPSPAYLGLPAAAPAIWGWSLILRKLQLAFPINEGSCRQHLPGSCQDCAPRIITGERKRAGLGMP